MSDEIVYVHNASKVIAHQSHTKENRLNGRIEIEDKRLRKFIGQRLKVIVVREEYAQMEEARKMGIEEGRSLELEAIISEISFDLLFGKNSIAKHEELLATRKFIEKRLAELKEAKTK